MSTAAEVTRRFRERHGLDAYAFVRVELTDSRRADGFPLLRAEVYSTKRQGANVPEQYRENRRSVTLAHSGTGARAFDSYSGASVSSSRDVATSECLSRLAADLAREIATTKKGAA